MCAFIFGGTISRNVRENDSRSVRLNSEYHITLFTEAILYKVREKIPRNMRSNMKRILLLLLAGDIHLMRIKLLKA